MDKTIADNIKKATERAELMLALQEVQRCPGNAQKVFDGDLFGTAIDTVTDLIHVCEKRGYDFEKVLELARKGYRNELNGAKAEWMDGDLFNKKEE